MGVEDKIDKLLRMQRSELGIIAIVTVIIITITTNMWSQYVFTQLGLGENSNIAKLLAITVVSIVIVWILVRLRK